MLRRHAAGFDPRDLAGAGVRAGADAASELAAARAAVAAGAGRAPDVLGYVVDLVRGTRDRPVACSSASRPRGATALLAASRAWAWLRGRAGAHARPRAGHGAAGAAAPHPAAARGGAGGRLGRRGAAQRDREGAGPAMTAPSPSRRLPLATDLRTTSRLAIAEWPLRPDLRVATGGAGRGDHRAGAAAAARRRSCPSSCSARFGAAWAVGTLLVWLALVVLLVVLDLAVAASPRRIRVERELPDAVRLGEPVRRRRCCSRTPDGGRIRGLVRDAWQPSAGAPPNRWPLDLPAGERRAFRDHARRPRDAASAAASR